MSAKIAVNILSGDATVSLSGDLGFDGVSGNIWRVKTGDQIVIDVEPAILAGAFKPTGYSQVEIHPASASVIRRVLKK